MNVTAKIEVCERCKCFRHSHPGSPFVELPIGYFGCEGNYKVIATQISIGPSAEFQSMQSGMRVPEWCPMTAELAVLEKDP